MHRHSYRFTIGEDANRLSLSLYGLEAVIPGPHDFVHWWRRIRKVLVATIGVQHGIVMGKERVLNLNLASQ